MAQPIELICQTCKHFTIYLGECKAFPDGIPYEIPMTNKHDKPLPNQKNNLIYEKDE